MDALTSKKSMLMLLVCLFCSILVFHVYADSMLSTENFRVVLATDDNLAIQSILPNATLTFHVVSGDLTAYASLFTSNTSGVLNLIPDLQSTCNLTITTVGNVTTYVNGEVYFGSFNVDSPTSITWTYTSSPIIVTRSTAIAFALAAVALSLAIFSVVILVFQRTRKREE